MNQHHKQGTDPEFSGLDNKAARFFDFVFPILTFVAFVIQLSIFGAAIYEGVHAFQQLHHPAGPDGAPATNFDISEAVLKIIELLFLSSIPLLIVISSYKYYKKVLRTIFIPTKDDSSQDSLMETLKATIDAGITKYNFYSILVSTAFIILFRKINGREPIDSNQIWIFGLIMVGIIALLIFLLKLKEGITESTLKIMKERDEINEKREVRLREDTILNLEKRITVLQSQKAQLVKDIAAEKLSIQPKVETIPPAAEEKKAE